MKGESPTYLSETKRKPEAPIPSARSRNTGLNSDELVTRDLFQECVCVSPSGLSGFLHINKHVRV